MHIVVTTIGVQRAWAVVDFGTQLLLLSRHSWAVVQCDLVACMAVACVVIQRDPRWILQVSAATVWATVSHKAIVEVDTGRDTLKTPSAEQLMV
jgi:hypothetical protein